MRIENVSVTATRQQLPQDYGVVTYTFVWTNFAAVDDGEIRAGDALAGFFLDEETSLRFSWPDGYALDTAQPQPDDTRPESRIVVWAGPLEFAQNEPVLVVVEQPANADDETTSAGGGGAGDGGSDDGGTNDGIGSGALLALGAILVVAAGASGWLAYRRYGERDADRGGASREGVVAAGAGAGGTEPDRSGRGASGEGADGSEEADESGDSEGMDSTGSGDESGSSGSGEEADESGSGEDDAGDAAGGAAAGADDSEADVRPWEDELLSNEERVLALVEHEGGRMKQQEVAQTLEWTDAKTSQVVRKMREADKLDAFRLGRENVLVLPGEEFGPTESR
jgi:hypothetical protein